MWYQKPSQGGFSFDCADTQPKRAEELVAQKFLSQQARAESESLAASEAKLERARQAVAGGAAASPDSLQALAEIAQSGLDLEHARIIAPADGWITNFSLVAGSSVNAIAPVAALIVDASYRVDANFKDTELARGPDDAGEGNAGAR
ncbi:MAG: hypothetical protein ABI585_02240 [Betaproteobacteria bacterium]